MLLAIIMEHRGTTGAKGLNFEEFCFISDLKIIKSVVVPDSNLFNDTSMDLSLRSGLPVIRGLVVRSSPPAAYMSKCPLARH